MALDSSDEILNINNLAKSLEEALEKATVAVDELGYSMQGRVRTMQQMIKAAQEGVILSERQLKGLKKTVDILMADADYYAKMKAYRIETNELLEENAELLKNVSDEEKSRVETLQNIAKDTKETAQTRAEAEELRLNLTKKQIEEAKVQEEIQNRQKEALKEYTDWVDEAGEKWTKIKDAIKGIIASPLTAAIVAGGILWQKLTDATDAIRDMNKQLGLTLEQTATATKNITAAAAATAEYGVSAKTAAEAYTAIVESTGDINKATTEAVSSVAKYMSLTGLSAEEAYKLRSAFSGIPGATDEFATKMMDGVRNMAVASKVPLGRVMRDISANTEAFQAAGKEGVKNLIAAAVYANKIGLSFQTLTNAAKGLLDIESSINAEMEASVLLGREVNLEKAREAAHRKDYVTMTNEILKNVGSAAEWERMSLNQQEALANAVNMQVEDLAKLIKYKESGQKLDNDSLKTLLDKNQAANEANAIAQGSLSYLSLQNAFFAVALVRMLGLTVLSRRFLENLSKGSGTISNIVRKSLKMFGGKVDIPLKEEKEMPEKKESSEPDTKEGTKSTNMVKNLVESLRNISYKDILKFVTISAAISVALLTLVPTLKLFAEIPISAIGKGIVSLIGLALGIKIIGNLKSDVIEGSFAMVIMALSLIPAAYAFQMIANVPIGNMIAFALASSLLAVSVGFMGQISKNVIKGAIAMAILGLALIPAAYAFQLIANVPIENMIAFSIIMPLLALSMAVIGILFTHVLLGSIALLVLSAALIPAAYAFSLLANVPYDNMIAFATIVPLLALAAAGLGFLSPFIILGSLALLTLGGSLAVFAKSMSLIKGIPVGSLNTLVITIPALARSISSIGKLLPLVMLGSLALVIMSAGLKSFGLVINSLQGSFEILTQVVSNFTTLISLTPGFFTLAAGIGELAIKFAGLAGSLSLIAPMLPVLAAVKALGVSTNTVNAKNTNTKSEKETSKEKEDANTTKILAKLDELIAAVRAGAIIEINGDKVGQTVVKYINHKTGSPAAGQKLIT